MRNQLPNTVAQKPWFQRWGPETLKVPGEARHTPQKKKKSETVELSLLRNVQDHFDPGFSALISSPCLQQERFHGLLTKCYQIGVHGLKMVYIFGGVWHENTKQSRKFTWRGHWEDEFGLFLWPLPRFAQATFLKHLHGRLHRGHTQADHTLCAKACMTHTDTQTHKQMELGIWLCR